MWEGIERLALAVIGLSALAMCAVMVADPPTRRRRRLEMPRKCSYDGVVEGCDLVHGICEWRRAAMDAREFVWDYNIGAWIWSEAPLRQSSFRARYFNEKEAGFHDGEPFRWTCCPDCGGELKPVQTASVCDDDGN